MIVQLDTSELKKLAQDATLAEPHAGDDEEA